MESAVAATKSIPQVTRQSKRSRRSFRQNFDYFLMAFPGLALLFVFSYVPMFGIVIAFMDYRASRGIFGSRWIGLKNFQFLFTSSDAWRITSNTLFLNLTFIITSTIAALFIAVLINEVRMKRLILSNFYQSSLLLPHFISWVVVGILTFAFLSTDSGIINNLLGRFGVQPVRWYSEPEAWRWILPIVNLWKHVGFSSLLYVAGLLGISPEYYEAAALDGASKWKQTLHITLPLLLPLIIITTLLAIGRIFYADFGLFYHVTRDSSLLYPTTDVIDTYVFRALRVTGNVGQAAAAGFYQSVVGFILVLLSNWLVRRIDPDRALF